MFSPLRYIREKRNQRIERASARPSFSQEGEDLLLESLFQEKSDPGFYVDVGALHPFRFSNTQLFYRKGWRGINIDATPGVMAEFERHRPRDINLHQAVAGERKRLLFHLFNEPALNGFSKELSERRHQAATPYRIEGTLEMEAVPLGELLDRHLPPGQKIDFLSIDVEGLDFEVLRSNHWEKYPPTVVLAEAADGASVAGVLASEACRFMESQGYLLVGKTQRTVFYQQRPAV